MNPESKATEAPNPLDADAQRIVSDEMEMAARVGRRIAKSLSSSAQTPSTQARGAFDEELVALRDQIGEARAEDVPALLAQMMQVAAVAHVGAPKAEGRVDPKIPYFGHLRLMEGGRPRDVLIGKRAMVDRSSGVVIVDWRNAPVSRIYYRYDEGDEYEEEFGEQVREGEVLVRRTVSFSNGRLSRVTCPSGMYLRKNSDDEAEAEWVAIPRLETPELKGGVGIAARAPKQSRHTKGHLGHAGAPHLRPDKHLPEIAALIDKSQFDAMTQTDSGVVVLQGGAGSGKTTVALHRIAWLAFQAPQRFRPKHMLVVVHQPALVKYVERVLPSLDVAGVKVMSYYDWAKMAVSRVLPKHNRKTIQEVPDDVSRVKKHPGMLLAIDEQLQRRIQELEAELSARLQDKPGAAQILHTWRTQHPKLHFLPRIEAFRHWLNRSGLARDSLERAQRALDQVGGRASSLLDEWEELITDQELLRHCSLGEQAVEARTLDSALRWTRQQIQEADDHESIDRQARTPVDDFDEESGDPRRKFDVHDLPLLLNLWIARTGGIYGSRGAETGRELVYDHVAVDEAQDLSAVETKPLLVATGKRRSLTLAGDIVQKVIFDNGFDDWETLLSQLGTTGTRVEPFRLTYRSTAEVIGFAREVLGPLAPPEAPVAVREGAPVEIFGFDDPGEEMAFLAENLRSVMGREPQANIAVLTRYPERAAFYAKMLKDAEVPRLRLVDGPEFSFSPGIDVTHISQVKGLEYDYVILVEATQAMYPNELAARHLLHIGATRAAYQLWVTTQNGAESLLLPSDRKLV